MEAFHNQILRDYFRYWWEREIRRTRVPYSTRREGSRPVISGGLREIAPDPEEERRIEEHVNRQIYRLVRDVKASMIEIESRFDSLVENCREFNQPMAKSEREQLLKRLATDLGEIRKKGKTLHGKLEGIYSDLPEKDDFEADLANGTASPCSLDELGDEIERTLPQVRETIGGNPQAVAVGDVAERNVLLGLYHLQAISEHLANLAHEERKPSRVKP